MAIINQAMGPRPAPKQNDVPRVIASALKALNQPQIEQGILQMIQSAGDPASGLAQALVSLFRALYEKSGNSIPMQAIGAAAKPVLDVLVKMCQSSGLLPKQVPPQLEDAVMQKAMQILASQQGHAPAGQPAQQPAQPIAQPTAQSQAGV